MSNGFTDHEKGDVAAEKEKVKQTKAAATAQQQPAPLRSPSPALTPTSGGEAYPLAPDKKLEARLGELVPQCAYTDAIGQVPTIRGSMKPSVQKYLSYAKTSKSGAPTEADILLNLLARSDVFHDVLFVSIKYNWNPDEVLALWQNEGLPNWARVTKGSTYQPGLGQASPWLKILVDFQGLPLTKPQARTIARSFILFQYWGLDLLAPVKYNPTSQDNTISTADVKAHDEAFDMGFSQGISSVLPGVTAAKLRESLTNDAIETSEDGHQCRLKLEYQATLLALQHARYKAAEAQIIKSSPLQMKDKTKVILYPPFAALIYLYFNSRNPTGSVELMTAGLKKKKSYSSQELCEAFVTSELPAEVVTGVDACHKNHGRLNCHGYMNALRFEFLRRVYEKVFAPTQIWSPRGCP